MKNIVLIGFMGTGKTTVGKEIARQLGMRFISTDDIIEKKASMPINDIFSKKGESYFRQLERETIMEISTGSSSVIDTGGGAVINELNMKDFTIEGILFCLNAAPEEILKRVGNEKHRPLLNVNDPLERIKELFKKREPYYKKADYQIDTSGKNVSEVAVEIVRIYRKLSSTL